MILYFYYKNIVIYFTQFLFLFFNGFSGQSFYDDFYLTFYNLFFTAWPVIARAIFEQDVPIENFRNLIDPSLKKAYHLLYYIGQKNKLFKNKYICYWLVSAFTTSTAVFLILFYSLRDSLVNQYGQNINIWYLSITIYTSIIIIVDLKLLVNTNYLTIFVIFSVFVLSLALYIGYSWIADNIFTFKIYKTMEMLVTSPIFYLSIGLVIGLFLIIEILIFLLEREFDAPLYLLFKSLVKNQNRFVQGNFRRLFLYERKQAIVESNINIK